MSVELRLLKDAVTGQPFVPVTHWDAVSNKPNIDGSLNSINASLNALDASTKALDASIKNIDIPIKSITGETGLTEYANSSFVAVSASQPDLNGNVLIDASVRVVTLADASDGHDGLASALDVYNELVDVEYTVAQHNIGLVKAVGLEYDYSIDWSVSSGINSSTIKDAIEYVAVNGGVLINDSSINIDETWSSSKINTEITGLKTVVDASLIVLDSSMDEVYSKFGAIDSSLAALDTSIRNINIPIKSITGEAGLAEYANSEFVAVSISEPDENCNVNVDASVKAVTLVDASNGHNGLAIAQDVYKELTDVEEVIASAQIQIANKIGLDSSLDLVWQQESGLTSENVKEAVEKIAVSVPTKTSELDNDSGFLTEHLSIKTIDGNELTGSGNIELKTINSQSIIGSGDITISSGVYQDPTSKKVYIEGIGGFDGTNSSSSQSLEEYLEGVFRNISSHVNELIARVEALESK